MGSRYGRLVGVLVLGLGPVSGCQLLSPGDSFLAVVKPSEPEAKPSKPDLSPKKTAELCFALAETLEKNGNEVEAVVEFEKARQANPELPGVSRHLAVLYDRLGQYNRAVAEYQEALKVSPKDADLLNDLAYCHYGHGKWDEAEKYLRQAVAINPHHNRAWVNLGMTLGQEGRCPESLEAFGKAVPPAAAHCNLGFILTTQGKFEEARLEYQQALTLEPGLELARAALVKLDKAGTPPSGTSSPEAAATALPLPGPK